MTQSGARAPSLHESGGSRVSVAGLRSLRRPQAQIVALAIVLLVVSVVVLLIVPDPGTSVMNGGWWAPLTVAVAFGLAEYSGLQPPVPSRGHLVHAVRAADGVRARVPHAVRRDPGSAPAQRARAPHHSEEPRLQAGVQLRAAVVRRRPLGADLPRPARRVGPRCRLDAARRGRRDGRHVTADVGDHLVRDLPHRGRRSRADRERAAIDLVDVHGECRVERDDRGAGARASGVGAAGAAADRRYLVRAAVVR